MLVRSRPDGVIRIESHALSQDDLIHDGVGRALKRWIIESGAAPGASAAVAAFRNGRWYRALGVAGQYTHDDPHPVAVDTLYDLASLTKPLVALLAARLVRAGRLDWQAPLASLLPAARGSASEATPLSLLASHRAGLLAHLRLGAYVEGPPPDVSPWLRRCAEARRDECKGPIPADGYEPLYSDLGYMLLGAVLGELQAQPLDELLEREVSAPLGLLELGSARGLTRALGDGFLERTAPTEVVAARGGRLRGVVHDENAWELAGRGLAGHAGAFGTARTVLGFCAGVLDALAGRRPGWLTSDEVGQLVRPRPGGSLRMGFDGKAAVGSSAGPHFGSGSFGHLGFTGTSLWCDPDQSIVVVLLTNRVSPSRDNIIIRSVRPDVHGELFGHAAGLGANR
jgi:serine-type D-Ala-D-Ala carboxypeptidase